MGLEDLKKIYRQGRKCLNVNIPSLLLQRRHRPAFHPSTRPSPEEKEGDLDSSTVTTVH